MVCARPSLEVEWLREAYRRTRKDGAVGVDGRTADEYAAKLEENLRSLLERFKSGSYHAAPVRRGHIPKDDGRSSRPIGIWQVRSCAASGKDPAAGLQASWSS